MTVENIKKIVVGTDFSKPARQAVTLATEVARNHGAELVLAYVGVDVEREYDGYDQEVHRWEEARFRERQDEMNALSAQLSGDGLSVSSTILQGHPAEALCQAAEDLQADLLVVGSHGQSAVTRFFLGSVAEKVVRHSPTTVLVARSTAPARGFRRILVPVAFDSHTDAAIEAALLMASDDAAIEIFHCWHLPTGLVESWGSGSSSLITDIQEGMAAQIRAKLGALVLRHRRPGIKLVFEQLEAPAQYGISTRLDSGDYDLAVVGSHQRRSVQRWLVGSVAEATVRHAQCSVAVIRVGQPGV